MAHNTKEKEIELVQDRLKKLMKNKESSERELKHLLETLEMHHVGMEEKLVDEEDFPRSDIDIPAVRTTRQRVICVRNDLQEVMSNIEICLHELHGLTKDKPLENSSTLKQLFENKPFLRVKQVDKNSPAEKAGFVEGDLLTQFGSVNSDIIGDRSTKEILKCISDLIMHTENKVVHVQCQRGSNLLKFELVPQRWSGNGLLGCVIEPV